MELKITELLKLIDKHGHDITLGDILQDALTEYPFKCPKCQGHGFTVARINTYPAGLPDSGWVDQMEDVTSECDLCKGHGRTKKEYTPIVEIKGYEAK